MTLIAHYPLQEDSGSTAYDATGNGNNGTVNGATLNATGLLGTSAYSFDGTDDYIDAPAVYDFSGGSGFTASIWFNGTTNDADHFISTGTDKGFYIRVDDGGVKTQGGLVFKMDDGTNDVFFGTANAYTDGNWHMATLVNDTSSLIGYVDGTEVNSGTHSVGDMADQLYIGAAVAGGIVGSYFPGKLADVRIYDHALSDSEVQYLYDVVANDATHVTDEQLL